MPCFGQFLVHSINSFGRRRDLNVDLCLLYLRTMVVMHEKHHYNVSSAFGRSLVRTPATT